MIAKTSRSSIHKYWILIQSFIYPKILERGELLGRIFLYTMVVYLYSQVFCSVKADLNRLWYISVTEWIILSTSSVSFQIAQDVKDGRIVYFLLRPIHYILFFLFY